jgi:membrane-bound inhibitor of C-type lysozyme
MTILRTTAIAALSLATLLAGCDRRTAQRSPAPDTTPPDVQAAPPVTMATYDCEGGGVVQASYQDPKVSLVFKGAAMELNKVAAADGSRYAGQGKQWWVKTFPDREEGTLASFVGTEQVASQVLARCVKRPAGATAPVATAATATAAICASGDLSLARVSEDAGAGQRQVVYSLKNNGRSACVLKGYPTLELIDANGADAPVKLVQTEAAFISLGGPPQDVTLAANGQAVFFIGFTGIQATDKPCVAVSRLRAIPPGNSQAIEIEDSIQPCTGEVKVTPVRQDTGVGMSKAFY